VFFQQPSGSGSVVTGLLGLTLLWRVFFPATSQAGVGRRLAASTA
jgi:hypothetical protein